MNKMKLEFEALSFDDNRRLHSKLSCSFYICFIYAHFHSNRRATNNLNMIYYADSV